MNSFTIGHIQYLLVLTTTDNQCAFSNTFTTLRARGLSQHPASTATSVVSIDSEGTIAIGGSLVNVRYRKEASLPVASTRKPAHKSSKNGSSPPFHSAQWWNSNHPRPVVMVVVIEEEEEEEEEACFLLQHV